MELVSLALGVVILSVVLLDILFTTLSADEHAILSFHIARPVFRGVRRIRLQKRAGWAHRFIGPFIMFLLASVWLVGVSLGWTLIFAAFPEAVDAAPGAPPPGWWDVYGHVGHLLSTLGLETTQPGGTASYVLGAVVAVNGFVLVTLATSFTLATTQTVVRGRAFAVLVQALDPAEPGNFATLAPELAQLCSALRAAPFALFYSSPREGLRLPEAFERFVRRAAEGEEFHRYRPILSQLPGLDPVQTGPLSSSEFAERLLDWGRRYSFG